jgi:hypothetical protein
VALGSLHANSRRCLAIALGLIALSVVVQWLSAFALARPERTRAVLEFLYVGRGAVLQALHITALALLTIGVLHTRLLGSTVVCAAWVAGACLIEVAQHPAVVGQLLQLYEVGPHAQQLRDATVGLLVNGRFAWSEVVASLLGGAVALALVGRELCR